VRFPAELIGQGGQDAGLVFGLGRQQPGGAAGLKIQDGPQAAEDVQAVQAQVVALPAGAQGGGQVPVAGPVHLLYPGLQPRDRLLPFGVGELPPCRGRTGTETAGALVGGGGPVELGGHVGDLSVRAFEPGQGSLVVIQQAADAGDQIGDLGQSFGDRGVVAGFAGVELGDLLVVGGQLGQAVGHVVGDVRVGPLVGCWDLARGFRGDVAVTAGAAVGGVLPGAGQPGDDRGAAAADHQGESGGQLADHVRGGDVVATGVLLAADLPRRLPAQLAGSVQGGDVGDAGQEHLHRGGVQDDLAAMLAPPSGQLRLTVDHRADLDALAAGI
jgi:hypothetical protein